MKYFILIIILFYVFSADCLTISEIHFEGNENFSADELKEVIISYEGMKFNQQIILEDAQRISNYYLDEGYLTAKVYTPLSIPQEDTLLIVRFPIEEGKESTISKITFSSNTYLDSSFIMENTYSPSDHLSELPDFIQEVIDLYVHNSFYFAEAEVSEISISDSGEIAINIDIDEGEFCRFTSALVTGNRVTKENTIIRLARLQGKKEITPTQIELAEQKLLARPYIKTCRISPIDSQTLMYEIEESAMTYLQAVLGYDNDSENKGRFQGFLDLQFDNLWGTDRSAGFFWEDRQEQHSSIELRYHESGWEMPLAGDIRLFREEMDSTWVEVSYSADIYWFDLSMKAGIYLEKQDIYPGSRRPEIIEHTQFYKAGMIWENTQLDHYFNPRKGTDMSLRYYYIWSKENDSEGGRQAVELSYFKAFPLGGKWVESFDVNANVIENKAITDFDLFYIGGTRSVRGFLEKQFSGYRTGWVNAETRYLLSTSARVSVNADLGYYKNKANGEDLIGSVGFGLRVPTPIGQFSLDIALPWQQDKFSGFMESIIHFGIETRL